MFTRQKQNTELFLVSFAILFIEVALIRWISTEIRIFAYINNLVLLACFLGIGLGCCLSKKKANLSITVTALSILIICVYLPFFLKIGNYYLHLFRDAPLLLSTFTDSVVWYEANVRPAFLMTLLGLASTLAVFFVVLLIFIPMGQILGRILDEYKSPIKAYSINVIASILGIWCFSIFSFNYSPPFYWFALVVSIILVMILYRPKRAVDDFLSILVFSLLIISCMFILPKLKNVISAVWSPYQKLEVQPYVDKASKIKMGYVINVNNVGYMALLNLSDTFIKKHSGSLSYDLREVSQYDIPYMFKKNADNVLILGAGGGNDAAGALRNAVESVDAVEIDPAIYDMGLEFHPEKPYSNPRVNVIIDDARSFLKRSKKRYDIISFGLLDAHTLSSSYNNMRVDHYAYTEESFREAKNLLKEDGIFTVIFKAYRPWISRRIHDLLEKVFGVPPVAFSVSSGGHAVLGGMMFAISKDMDVIDNAIKNNSGLDQLVSKNKIIFSEVDSSGKPVSIKLTTDDWPYLYLEKPVIPKMHLCLMGILLLLFTIAKRTILAKGQKLNLHFFFLGAAFLLLEFQNISKSTLLFGSTCLVNVFIISAILFLILFANLFVSVFKIKNLKPVYLLLVLSIIVTYLVPLSFFNFLGYWQKSILVSLILNLPIFFAGIIFITSFKKTKSKDLAFGSNFIGAAFGGILESLSFVVGINNLLLLVVAFYILSLIFLNRNTDYG